MQAETLYVDASAEMQNTTCGTEENPCRDIEAVIGMASPGGTIKLAPSSVVYRLRDHMWLSKDITIQGHSSWTKNTTEKAILSTGKGFLISPRESSLNARIHVTFQRLIIDDSSMMIGDASVRFHQVEMIKVEIIQQFIKKKTIQSFSLDFENSEVSESNIATRPWNADARNLGTNENVYQPTFYTVKVGSLTLRNSDIYSSSFNLTAKQLRVDVQNTVFSNQKICPTKSKKIIERDLENLGANGESNFDVLEACKKLLKEKGIIDTGLHLGVGILFSEDENQNNDRNKRDLTRYKEKRESPNQPSTSKSSITIKHSTFLGMVQQTLYNQAALTLIARHHFEMKITSCNFKNNERAVNVDVEEGGGGSIVVKSSTFISNRAWGPGGGIHLYQVSGHTTITIEDTAFTNNTALGLTDKLSQLILENGENGTIRNIELSKISGSGGAIALNVEEKVNAGRCKAVIRYCTFKGNSAENFGGTMYITTGVTTTLLDNEFRNVAGKSSIRRQTIGDIIESRGNIIMTFSNFTVETAFSDIPIFSYRADRGDAFLLTNEVQFECPKGYQADELMSTLRSQATIQQQYRVAIFMLYCRACSEGMYSLEFAKIRLTKERIVYEQNRTCKGEFINLWVPLAGPAKLCFNQHAVRYFTNY